MYYINNIIIYIEQFENYININAW